jgi:hypothetical protein
MVWFIILLATELGKIGSSRGVSQWISMVVRPRPHRQEFEAQQRMVPAWGTEIRGAFPLGKGEIALRPLLCEDLKLLYR